MAQCSGLMYTFLSRCHWSSFFAGRIWALLEKVDFNLRLLPSPVRNFGSFFSTLLHSLVAFFRSGVALLVHFLCVQLNVASASTSFLSSSIVIWLPILLAITALLAWVALYADTVDTTNHFLKHRKSIAPTHLSIIPLFVPWLQALSTFSSSYVEEEHQFWYAFHQVILMLLLARVLQSALVRLILV